MVKLDYRTNNPRWGLVGVVFKSWESYAFTLGYLSNPAHYDTISVHIEGNDVQGAWDKEGRIHYYGTLSSLKSTFADLYACSSAGTGRITKRINSNGYILSLIHDYGFKLCPRHKKTTADVFPPNNNSVYKLLKQYLLAEKLPRNIIRDCLDCFDDGFNL